MVKVSRSQIPLPTIVNKYKKVKVKSYFNYFKNIV